MLPNMVDEVTGGENISILFAKYDDLYNSVAYNEEDMASFLQNIYINVDAQCNDCENIVTIDDVLNGINHVKSTKCDGYGLAYTDHFIHAPHKLHVFLSFLLTSVTYDCVIMIKWADAFETSDLQFGFKPQRTTAKCAFTLMEIVNYFQQNKSDVYVLFLDATKAFDKVNYVKLFYLLMD